MGTRQNSSEIDNILNETEIGQVIAKNKMIFVALAVIAVLGVFVYGGFSSWNKSASEKHYEIIRVYQENFEKLSLEKTVNIKAIVSSFQDLKKKIGSSKLLFYPALITGDFLRTKGALSESENVYQQAFSSVSIASSSTMLGLRLAVVKEDLKKYDQAIKVLEKVAAFKIKAFEGKIYLDIGRIYSLKGNKEKAKSNYQYVIDNSSDTEMLKLARLGLAGL